MGTALVMPTNDWKMLMPRTAASLQRAFRKPKAVHLHQGVEQQKKTLRNIFMIHVGVFFCISHKNTHKKASFD